MIKTKYGFFEWSNGYIQLFILEQNRHTFNLGIETDDLNIVIESACLVLDHDGLVTNSNWPSQVTCKFQLINKIKEINIQGNDIK